MLTTDVGRDAAHCDDFFEARLRFGIRRPAGWRFLSSSGSPAARALGRRADATRPHPPFVAMVRDVASDRHPRPTIQVSCRRVGPQAEAKLRQLLRAHLDSLRRQLDGFELLTSSLDNIVGGRRTAHLQYRYVLHVPCGAEACPMPVLAHNYLVPTAGLVFTIAMSSSQDGRYFDEGDFAAALASVRIGSSGRRRSGPTFDRPRVIGWTGTPARVSSS